MSVNKELISEAMNSLSLAEIGLFGSEIQVSKKYHPCMAPNLTDTDIRYRHTPKSISRLTLPGAPEDQTVLRYLYDTEAQVLKSVEGADDEALFTLHAIFFCDYLVNPGKTPTEECLLEFGRCNVGFQIWPYWREYFSSCLIRCGFPSMLLPMYNLKSAAKELHVIPENKETT